jgi:sulfatase maturation enzyme AslB (radical SAM superfamily)
VTRVPTIEWQVAGACNYDCSYCIQSPRYRKGRPQKDQLERAIASFASLPGSWEIKCSGGEAFAHPLFMSYVVPELMARTEHRISVLTNFSATKSELMQFVQQTRGRLAVFSASLHLEFVDVEDFAAKAEWFSLQLDGETAFVVNQVVLPGKEDEAEKCRDVIEARGIRWFPQLYKVDGGVADYDNPDELVQLIGKRPANTAPSFRGRTCWAGVDYAVVDKNGDAWSCRTAKRYGEGALGNLFDGSFARLAAPAPCTYDICPCSVPANRGMIE